MGLYPGENIVDLEANLLTRPTSLVIDKTSSAPRAWPGVLLYVPHGLRPLHSAEVLSFTSSGSGNSKPQDLGVLNPEILNLRRRLGY
jgi:hypothetical protein